MITIAAIARAAGPRWFPLVEATAAIIASFAVALFSPFFIALVVGADLGQWRRLIHSGCLYLPMVAVAMGAIYIMYRRKALRRDRITLAAGTIVILWASVWIALQVVSDLTR